MPHPTAHLQTRSPGTPLSVPHPYPAHRQLPPVVLVKASIPDHKTRVCAPVHPASLGSPTPVPDATPRSAASEPPPNVHQSPSPAHPTAHTTTLSFPIATLAAPSTQSV